LACRGSSVFRPPQAAKTNINAAPIISAIRMGLRISTLLEKEIYGWPDGLRRLTVVLPLSNQNERIQQPSR